MDINKEREDFEAALISKRIFDKADIENYVVFYADQNKYQPSTTCTEDEVFATEWINVGWRMWCEAKKQAIPTGFVLMPKQPTPKMIDATWNFDEKIQDMSHNSRNEFIYNTMIAAAQEPTND
ncbi:hypothetical protein [Acinetobacter guillouiae]|uniref:hypothetical protein n=1 Tax=Acinetobacter guillouiae TaxID=106649 RepID=UPI0028D31A9B|nr:hypothetical protein [Acinetobacter guillouiae]